jgi:hypothetical protein
MTPAPVSQTLELQPGPDPELQVRDDAGGNLAWILVVAAVVVGLLAALRRPRKSAWTEAERTRHVLDSARPLIDQSPGLAVQVVDRRLRSFLNHQLNLPAGALTTEDLLAALAHKDAARARQRDGWRHLLAFGDAAVYGQAPVSREAALEYVGAAQTLVAGMARPSEG